MPPILECWTSVNRSISNTSSTRANFCFLVYLDEGILKNAANSKVSRTVKSPYKTSSCETKAPFLLKSAAAFLPFIKICLQAPFCLILNPVFRNFKFYLSSDVHTSISVCQNIQKRSFPYRKVRNLLKKNIRFKFNIIHRFQMVP